MATSAFRTANGIVLVGAMTAAVGCLMNIEDFSKSGVFACSSTANCIDGYQCIAGVCVEPPPSRPAGAPVCSNLLIESGETCDDGNLIDGDGCDSNCTVTGCGNGIVTTGERCDDGNDIESDDCTNRCTVAACGDGVLRTNRTLGQVGFESCDDAGETATCNADCTAAACGDGVTNASAGETCDDGNTNECIGDCSADCSTPVTITGCGDGIVCGTEHCDDAGETVACDVDCTAVECGDGIRNSAASEDITCEPWITILGGSFMMGSTVSADEQPIHEVTVPTFEMMATEVTVADYQACVDAGGCTTPNTDTYCNWGVSDRGDHPVNCIDWYQAGSYCTWVGGRLPSEAEWEYAARGRGQDITYPWGNQTATCDYAVMAAGGHGCGENRTWTVCGKPAGNTSQGLCDMAGNVWEWVQDGYHSSYAGAPVDGSAWEAGDGLFRVRRGGSWFGNYADYLRTSDRIYLEPDGWGGSVGFRCVRPSS